MKIIKNMLFHSSKENGSEGNFETARAIGNICDRISFAVFKKYRKTLLEEPITYIVWATWGAKRDGKLDEIQIEINRLIAPEIDKVMAFMKGDSMSPEQTFSVHYLVRGYIISKIIYMIESYRLKSFERSIIGERSPISLSSLQPIGSA